MRLLVTGGAGFIGSNLCRLAAAEPAVDHVVVLDDLSTGSESSLRGVDLIPATVLDEAALDKACAGADAVIHTHGVGHVVVASSSSVYGANPELPKPEDTWTRPLSPYAAVVPRFLDAALNDRPVEVLGDGQQSRDFTVVGTVCEVLLDAAMRRVRCPSPVNLAFGERTTILELVALMERVLGRPIRLRHTAARAGDVRHSQADGTLLRELFPAARATSLLEGLRQTAGWLPRRADG